MRWLLLLVMGTLWAEPCVVFIHIGPELPDYLSVAAAQARLFNPGGSIYVLANEAALKGSKDEFPGVVCVPCETVPKGSLHEKFLKQTKLNKGFWTVTTERFFYLADLMHEYKLGEVVHLESDVMLYTDLAQLIPTFRKYYGKTIGATFDNDERGIAGLVYIPQLRPLNHFLEFIIDHSKDKDANDMVFLGQFKQKHLKQYIDTLPIIIADYVAEHPLVSANGSKGSHGEEFINHIAEFGSIFDAAALGQYLGGNHHQQQPGFVNEACVFNPSLFQFEWGKDNEGRSIPFAVYKEKRWKINNLHVHCKKLKEFTSK